MTGTNMVDAGFSSDALDNIVEDTTPQLGGDLDVNGNDIVSVSNGDINLVPNGTGEVQANVQSLKMQEQKLFLFPHKQCLHNNKWC